MEIKCSVSCDGDDWIKKKNFFNIGMFLYMKGKCQPKQWRQDEYEVKINTIELLPDVKDKVIEKMTVNIPLSDIDDELIEELSSLANAHPGNVELHFHIQDEEGQHIHMTAKSIKISVQKDIIEFLKSQTALSYKIN